MSAEEDNRKIENSLKSQFKKEGMEWGMKRGMKEGMKEGMKAGMKEGMKEGIIKGERQKNLENAKKMLEKGISVDDIVDITGLSVEEIKKL